MIFKGKPTIDNLDFYLARREYDVALAAILQELKRQPGNSNLTLRQAEVLILMDDREAAIELYRKLAEDYTDQGFYARAIAVANKILRLDPSRTSITAEVAQRISSRQAADQVAREKLSRAAQPRQEDARPDPTAVEAPQPIAPAAERADAEESGAWADAQPERPAPDLASLDDDGRGTVSQEEKERIASEFFGAFPPAALEKLLAVTSVRSFAADEVILREGEPGASLFLITEGRVEVKTSDPSGREIRLARLGPGDFFGEVSVLTGKPRTASVVAREAGIVIEIGQNLLRDIFDEYPEVEEVLRAFYEKRAQATVDAMVARLRGRDG